MVGAPRRGALRRRRRARHGRHGGPGHLPVALHVLELHREPLRRRRGGLLVPHAELGHRRRPLPVRSVALRRGGPRARLLVLPLRMLGAVGAGAASPVRGLGLVLVLAVAVLMVAAAMVLCRRWPWARPWLELRRRRELALLSAPAARVRRRAAGAPGSPVVDLPVGPPLLLLAAAARGRRPRRRRRRRDAHHGSLLGVVGVERPVQRRRGGALVLAHLVEVGRVPDIVAFPGAELGHGGAFLQASPGMNNEKFMFSGAMQL